MVNGTTWGFTVTFLWALQALVPGPAFAGALGPDGLLNDSLNNSINRTINAQLNDYSILNIRMQGLGLKLPGGFAYQLRSRQQQRQEGTDLEEQKHGLQGDENYKLSPTERKSFMEEVQENFRNLKAYTGKDFDPIRINIRAPGRRPALLIENMHNDEKGSHSIFNAIKNIEIDSHGIRLEFRYTFSP